MPNVAITLSDGTSHTVNVDESFLKMAPDQQNAMIDQIASDIGKGSKGGQYNLPETSADGGPDESERIPVPGSQADADAEAANADQPWLNDPIVSQGNSQSIPPLPPGYTLDPQPWLKDPIVSQAGGNIPPLPAGFTLDQPQSGPKDTSWGSALQQGAHDALEGLGSTFGLISKDAGWKGGQDIGQAVQNAIPAPANYDPATSSILAKIKAGQIVGALKDLPRAAVEGAPAIVGGLGAAALGAAATPELLGGAAVGGALGAAGYGAASNFGDDANARAAANGHATPTAGDQAVAGLTAAGQGALNAVGLAKVPGVSALLRATPSYAKALAAGSVDAAGQAASNVVGQVGNTAGTQQGLTVDPAQAAAAAIQAGAARVAGKAASQTAGAVGDGLQAGVKSVGMSLAAGALPPMTPEQAVSYSRINAAYDAQSPARGDANPTQQMNALWKNMRTQLQSVISTAADTGQINDDTAASLKTAMQTAGPHKSVLDTNVLDKLNSSSVDPQLSLTLRNGLTDLDNVSQMVSYRQASGPFAAIGAKLAAPVATASLLATGHLGDAAMVAMGLGHTGIAGRVGAVVGQGLDKLAGTNLPPSLILRSQAMKQAQDAGYDLSTDALAPLSQTYDTLQALKAQQGADAAVQQAAQQQAAARARAADLQETAANQVSGIAYSNSPEGIIAKANAAVRRRDILTQAVADGRLAQPMSQDQLDRVSVGLSPSDPIPVNTPLDSNDQPLQQPQGPRLSPPSVTPGQQQPGAPQVAPASPQGGSAGGYNPSGWLEHYDTALRNNGVAPTTENIGTALARAVANQRVQQGLVDDLLANPNAFLGDRSTTFQHLVAQAVQDSGQEPSPVVAQPVSPLKYGLAATSRQNLGGALMDAADGAGDQGLKLAIARILASPDLATQQGIAERLMAERQNDAVALERAKQLLPPELFKGRGK